VYYHGNNKTEEELAYAIEHNVGQIVVDNLYELKTLERLACIYKQEIKIYLRLNVGIEAHTHRYVITAHIDSKFGVLPASKDFQEMLEIINQSKYLRLVGLHSHIGSQIFDLTAFQASIERLIQIVKSFDYPLAINLGGGFGVKYTDADQPIPYDAVAKFLIESVEKELEKQKVHITKLLIEPGRSIVAEAGTTLYTIGSLKQTPNKLYYFIDGGMTDNIRPALYQANYAADIVGKEFALKNKVVTIAGKCCESGDLIIENTLLPEAEPNDLLVTYSTGAYGYSMSSNYNKALTPAVVFVEDGIDRLVVKRQTIEQLLEREI
ncbi:MAG: diaminopimelate decarboxylase, partial [Anaeroplasmataceae bacterium]|nr:diaminopimelate decarboxylase [Anaeroplasmataceae bacterium]